MQFQTDGGCGRNVGGVAEKGMGNVRLLGVRPKWRHDWRKNE